MIPNLLVFNPGTRIIILEGSKKKKEIGYDVLKEKRDMSSNRPFSQKNTKGESVTYQVVECLPGKKTVKVIQSI